MQYSAVVFDLDGTLLDTLDDIANAANDVLNSAGYPTHPIAAYRQFVGDGVAMLFQRALPATSRDRNVIERCAERFHDTYEQHWDDRTRPYDGIPELLDRLTELKLPLAVLSNKPHAFTERCVARFLARWEFQAVFGQRENVPRKPDPAAAQEIAASLSIPPDSIVYLGDSNVDMQTARAAGMYAIGAAWGFRSAAELHEAGAELVIESPEELLRLFV